MHSPAFSSTPTYIFNDLTTAKRVASRAMKALRSLKSKIRGKARSMPESSLPLPGLALSQKASIIDVLPIEVIEEIIFMVRRWMFCFREMRLTHDLASCTSEDLRAPLIHPVVCAAAQCLPNIQRADRTNRILPHEYSLKSDHLFTHPVNRRA